METKKAEQVQGMQGITRKMDNLGRIVIPKEVRDELGIEPLDEFEIFAWKDGTIMLKKTEEAATTLELALRNLLKRFEADIDRVRGASENQNNN